MDQNSISKDKNKLPKGFLVKSFGGVCMDFTNPETALQEKRKAKELEIEHKELSAGMDIVDSYCNNGLAGGLMSKYGFTERKDRNNLKKKRDRAFMAMIFRIILQQSIRQIQDLIRFHQAQMDKIFEQIQEAKILLKNILGQKELLKEAIKQYRNTGILELNEKGEFKNQVLEQIVSAYEKKKGIYIDRHDPEIYLTLLEVLEDLERTENQLRGGIKKYQKDYEAHKIKRDEAKAILDDLKNGNLNQQRTAVKKLDAFTIYQKIDLALVIGKKRDNPQPLNGIINELDITKDDLKAREFSFDFPPMQNDFNNSVQENKVNEPAWDPKKEPAQKIKNNQIQKPGL